MSWHAGRCEEGGKEKNQEEGKEKNEEEGEEKNEEEMKEKNQEEGGREREVPDYKTQKQELQAVLQQRLRKGDTWYECVHVPHHSL